MGMMMIWKSNTEVVSGTWLIVLGIVRVWRHLVRPPNYDVVKFRLLLLLLLFLLFTYWVHTDDLSKLDAFSEQSGEQNHINIISCYFNLVLVLLQTC